MSTWHLHEGTLHVQAPERLRAVSRGLLHGAVELHPQVSPLRNLRPEPGGEEGVLRGQRLPVRVQAGLLLQGEVRHVSAPRRVSARPRRPEQRDGGEGHGVPRVFQRHLLQQQLRSRQLHGAQQLRRRAPAAQGLHLARQPVHELRGARIQRRSRLPERNPAGVLRSPADSRQATAPHRPQAALSRRQKSGRDFRPGPGVSSAAGGDLGRQRHGGAASPASARAQQSGSERRRRPAAEQAEEDRLQPEGAVRFRERGGSVASQLTSIFQKEPHSRITVEAAAAEASRCPV